MDKIILKAFQTINHSPEWLNRYLNFLEDSAEPEAYAEGHHILPVSVFPEFKLFGDNSWNRIDLSPQDHLIAHYFLLKALPLQLTLRYAFCAMTRTKFDSLRGTISPTLLQEMAEEYAYQRTGMRWVVKGGVEAKILPSDQAFYLAEGWKFGRKPFHTAASKASLSKSHILVHQRESLKEDAYSYLPHGDAHHRRVNGISEETKAKISATLTGTTRPPEVVEKCRLASLGRHWTWTAESKARIITARTGPNSNRYGKVGHWAGKTRSEESKEKTSASVKAFNQANPERSYEYRNRGEDHHYYGKQRDAETCAKISASLTGKKDSDQARKNKSEAAAMLKAPTFTDEQNASFHAVMRGEAVSNYKCSGTVKLMIKGLETIRDGRCDEVNRKYWRMAETWIKLNPPTPSVS